LINFIAENTLSTVAVDTGKINTSFKSRCRWGKLECFFV